MTLHVIHTWLLTNLLHPLTFLAFAVTTSYAAEFVGDITGIILFCGAAAILSLPALFIAALCLKIIIAARPEPSTGLFAWIITVIASITLNAFVLCLPFGGTNIHVVSLFIPAIIASVIAILIRFNQFQKLFINNETN